MQGPYHLIPLAVALLAAYLLTLLLVRWQVISQSSHRKIWNSLLLLSFLVSGLLGLLLAVRLNYRLSWPFLDSWLKWHVDAGILLCLAGAFHLTWHASYYLRMFRKQGATDRGTEKNQKPAAAASAAPAGELPARWILACGFLTTVVQVLLLRAVVVIFQGNELMMGWTLGIWMFLTGAGSWLGHRRAARETVENICRLTLYLSWLPPLLLTALTLGRNLLYPPGTLVNPFLFMLLLLVWLAPFCLPAGVLYSRMVRARGPGRNRFIRVYGTEALGSLLGGLAVSLLFIRWFNLLQGMAVTTLLVTLLLLTFRKNNLALVPAALAALLTLLTFVLPLETALKKELFRQKVVESRETAGGNITITENGGEYSFYDNGNLLFTTNDEIVSEEFVHYALLQHPAPCNVLLVSGGVAGMIPEILKYPGILRIDYVEPNPRIIQMVSPYQPLPDDPRIRHIRSDGRRFLRSAGRRYDAAILAVPDPGNLQVNRYYTTEFISILKSKLTHNGVVIYGISPAGNYLTTEKQKIGSALLHALDSHFRHTVIVPGERDYFIASDSPVTARIGGLSALRGTPNRYVHEGYMDDESLTARGGQIKEQAGRSQITNSDLHPLPVFYHSLHYLSQFGSMKGFLLALPVVLLLLPLLLMNPVSAGMYVTGFTASSAEMMLIFWFQLLFGNLYSAVGIIFALFMGGLALGSFAGFRLHSGGKGFMGLQVLLGLYMLLLPLLWHRSSSSLSGALLWLLFIPALLVPAFLTGLQYVNASRIYHPDTVRSASAIYAADLWGSALGAIAATTLLVPVAGIRGSCYLLALLNGLVALWFLAAGQLRRK